MLRLNKNIRTQLALLFLAAFAIVLLIKPVHLLVHDHSHDHEQELVSHCDESHPSATVQFGAKHEVCPICDFEFCQFIPQQKVLLPYVASSFCLKQVAPTLTCVIRKSSHLFQLRAPPVV